MSEAVIVIVIICCLWSALRPGIYPDTDTDTFANADTGTKYIGMAFIARVSALICGLTWSCSWRDFAFT